MLCFEFPVSEFEHVFLKFSKNFILPLLCLFDHLFGDLGVKHGVKLGLQEVTGRRNVGSLNLVLSEPLFRGRIHADHTDAADERMRGCVNSVSCAQDKVATAGRYILREREERERAGFSELQNLVCHELGVDGGTTPRVHHKNASLKFGVSSSLCLFNIFA